MKIEVLFEDEYCLIINKPNNVLVHHSHYARNITSKSVEELLFEQFNKQYYLVHRLDYKTSGVLMLTKEKEHIQYFQELFSTNNITKEYFAVVRGFVNEEVIINTPVKHPETKQYKEAETVCIPLFTKELAIAVHPYDKSRYSLVKLLPKTGRIHQLRIHMNKISHPIVGDYKYGDRFHNRMFETEFNCYNLFLHAKTLKFQHPFTKEKIMISAALPSDWIQLFKRFKWGED
jgi:tRNA pseudouridine65 synthase